ncbi:MAG TPA: GDSL-type esterase/lipase family protein [Allosphingosinicella sp.]|jgi:lysophospholipase L1-like esterase
MAYAAATLLAAFSLQPGCTGNLCGGEALAPLLERLEQGQGVHILQLGDSHTAGDMITQPLRAALQARWGKGGRGVLPPGRPYPGYLTWGVTAFQSGPWRVGSLTRGGTVGLSGYTQSVAAAGASLGVTGDDEANRFDRITVCALTGPEAGTVTLRIGERRQDWPLAAAAPGAECRSIESTETASAASITTVDARRVSITSFATFRKAGGVALSNLGVSGSQLVHQGRQADAIVRAELQAYAPDLVILAFGTNEGFTPRFDAIAYERDLRAQVARIRRLAARDVPILILGAPDAATRNAALANNAGPGTPCGGGGYVPSALAAVRDVQRRTARDLRLAYRDWHAAMGGTCASVRWAARGLMRGDLVHFTRAGGEAIGRALFHDLTRRSLARP